MASVRSPHDLKLHDSIVEEVLALKLLRRKQVRLAPRTKLVRELHRKSDLFTTQQLKGKDFFHDTVVKF